MKNHEAAELGMRIIRVYAKLLNENLFEVAVVKGNTYIDGFFYGDGNTEEHPELDTDMANGAYLGKYNKHYTAGQHLAEKGFQRLEERFSSMYAVLDAIGQHNFIEANYVRGQNGQ